MVLIHHRLLCYNWPKSRMCMACKYHRSQWSSTKREESSRTTEKELERQEHMTHWHLKHLTGCDNTRVSVNRSQTDIKCKNIFKPGINIFFSIYPPPTFIHLSYGFTNALKPAAQKSFDCCLSHFRTSFSASSSLREFLNPVVNRFTRPKLPTVNRNHFFMNILCIESFCLQKTHNTTLLFGGVHLKHGRNSDYWNQPLNMRMRVCYLDCHEAGLCCYLVIHIENLLRSLQLLYFHFLPIHWLSLV
jgi:hypothetical protein